MSNAGSEGMAGMTMVIPGFVKSDVLLGLAVTLPRCLLYACTQQPHRATLTGEHGLLQSHWQFGPERLGFDCKRK